MSHSPKISTSLEYHIIQFRSEDPGGTGVLNCIVLRCLFQLTVLTACELESTLVPEAGKRKRGRPRKVVHTGGTMSPISRMDDSSDSESEAGRESRAVSLVFAFSGYLLQGILTIILACYFKNSYGSTTNIADGQIRPHSTTVSVRMGTWRHHRNASSISNSFTN